MKRQTFGQMAETLNVELCRGITKTGHYCKEVHEREGSITDGPVIHYSDRPPTRASIHTFLRLVARAQEPSIDRDEPWRRVYRLNMAERRLAGFLRIKNPGHPAREDRAFVLASVAGIPNDVPMRKQAYDWARRGPKRQEVNQ